MKKSLVLGCQGKKGTIQKVKVSFHRTTFEEFKTIGLVIGFIF
ncbi:hypothetical protein Pint_02483 [Pistacia integerrima]|uniref:Uncharacterized protein n=1 Tax=Pistacia integerrima TaxID=434235 RepID=A0ACC0ZS06_9ROSI|nr:hypothetical protein Pint_02483 [Pistacia integerrima]